MLPSRSPLRESGGIGRRAGLRIQWPKGRGGSSPSFRTSRLTQSLASSRHRQERHGCRAKELRRLVFSASSARSCLRSGEGPDAEVPNCLRERRRPTIASPTPTHRCLVPAYRPRSRSRLHIGFVVAGMATTLLGPILPALTQRWAMSDVVAGSLFTAQFLSSMTATLVAPATAARIGARGALALGFSLLAAGTFTIGISPHAIGIVATVVYGLGLGFVLPLTNMSVAAIRPDRAASALSLVNVSWGIGAVIWPMAVRSFGTPASVAVPMAGLAIACLMMAITCRFAVPAALLTVSGHRDGDVAPHPQAPSARRDLAARAALLGTLIFLYVGTENAVAGWVAEFARRMVAGTTTVWALAPTAFWGAITSGRLIAALALRHISEFALIRFGLALATLGVLAILVRRVDARRRDCRRGRGRLRAVGDLSAALGDRHAIDWRDGAGNRRSALRCRGSRRRRDAVARRRGFERSRQSARRLGRSACRTRRTGALFMASGRTRALNATPNLQTPVAAPYRRASSLERRTNERGQSCPRLAPGAAFPL